MDTSEDRTLQILSNATGTNTELLNIKVSPNTGDIVVQLDVFNEASDSDKASRPSSTSSIDLNSHHDVFQAILQQITKTPHELAFLHMLHHLLAIDSNEALSHVIWNVAEKLVYRATQLENNEDAERLLNSTVTQTFSCQKCSNGGENVNGNESNETDLSSVLSPSSSNQSVIPATAPPQSSPLTQGIVPPPPPPPLMQDGIVPPPPPPPLMQDGIVPPPPPLPLIQVDIVPPPPHPPNVSGLPPPPPRPLQKGYTSENILPSKTLLLQQNVPKSTKKLKSLNWSKIPHDKIMHKYNIWTIMANDRQYKHKEIIDFKSIEGLFCLQQTENKTKGTNDVDSSGSRGKGKGKNDLHLLDSRTSLKINIFLSQFKSNNSHEDIAQLIRNGDHKAMGLEKLKDLIKFIEMEEIITPLQNFNEDRQQLGSAEKFMLLVMDITNYKLRIECMKLKEEFNLNIAYLEPCIQEILKAGNELMNSHTLQEILAFIMTIGNFLNSGGYAGNAAGIKLSSLSSLSEIKANKNGMHLLHLIALEVERYNPDLLDLSKELNFLGNVYRVNIEQIEKDIKGLESGLRSIKKQIISPTTAEDLKQQMAEFLQEAEKQIENLNKNVTELGALRLTMAEFFCEDLKHFKIDECFAIFHRFCEQFKQAIKENEKRLQLEQQAVQKQKLKEEQLINKIVDGKNKPSPTSKRFRSSRSSITDNEKFILCENKAVKVADLNSKKNEDDLMKFLQSQQQETCLNPERSTVVSLRSRTKNFKNLTLTNFNRKSRKDLMHDSTAAHLRDKCLTSDLTRERLNVFIRSNSTIDSKSGLLSKQPAVIEIIKTPLMQNKKVFNFAANDIQTIKTTNVCTTPTEVEIRRPKISLKTLAHITQHGRRYSSINEEDLQRTIKNLRTPTLENKEFCWSPMPRSFPISPLNFENTFASKIEPVSENPKASETCNNSQHVNEDNNATELSKTDRSLITQNNIENSFDLIDQRETHMKNQVDKNSISKHTEPKENRDKTEESEQYKDDIMIIDPKDEKIDKYENYLPTSTSLNDTNEKDSIKQSPIEDKSATMPHYTEKFCENILTSENKKPKQATAIPRPKYFISNLTNKLRSFQPLRQSISSSSLSDTNKTSSKLFKINNNRLQASIPTNSKLLNVSTGQKSYSTPTLCDLPPPQNNVKPNFSKNLLNGLQNKLRSLSPLT